jgi:hypothetical protein
MTKSKKSDKDLERIADELIKCAVPPSSDVSGDFTSKVMRKVRSSERTEDTALEDARWLLRTVFVSCAVASILISVSIGDFLSWEVELAEMVTMDPQAFFEF